MSIKYKTSILLTVFLFVFASSASTEAYECALVVRNVTKQDVEYQPRENRCEGTFRQKVSGRVNLRVVGYHQNRLHANIGVDPNIELRVLGETGAKARLTVISLRPDDYYQMDTNSLEINGGFRWNTDVLRQLPFPPRPYHLAALGCSAGCNGKTGEVPILNAVIFGAVDAAPEKDAAVVLVMSDVELKSLSYTLSIEGDDEAPKTKTIASRFIPALRAQKIVVSDLAGRAVSLTLKGETRTGRQAFYKAVLSPITRGQ